MKTKNLTFEIIKIIISFFAGWIAFIVIFSVFTPELEELSDFHTKLSGLLSIVVAIVFSIITNYNKVFRLREIVKARLSSIEVEQKKGKKLINQAIDVMNRYMQHEKDTHQNVAKYRSSAFGVNTSNNFEAIKRSNDFQGLIEHYPDLKANTGVQQLLNEIINSENAVSEAKKLYNNVVTEYNSVIHSFPLNITRSFMKLSDMDYYSEPEEEIEITI